MIIESVWFFLPAGIANMAPVIAQKLFGPGTPINPHLFGTHKTWQGLISGTICGWLFFLLQVWLSHVAFFARFSMINYNTTSSLVGVALGFGAICGDMVKSLFKRYYGIPPGKPWIPFDQLDYVLGGVLFVSLLVVIPWLSLLTILIVYPLLHVLTNLTAYALRIRNEWL